MATQGNCLAWLRLRSKLRTCCQLLSLGSIADERGASRTLVELRNAQAQAASSPSLLGMTRIAALWRLEAAAHLAVWALAEGIADAHSTGSLENLEARVEQGLSIHTRLVLASQFYDSDRGDNCESTPQHFPASPAYPLCGLALHNWRHTASSSRRVLARRERAQQAYVFRHAQQLVLMSSVFVNWHVRSRVRFRLLEPLFLQWARETSCSAYVSAQPRCFV